MTTEIRKEKDFKKDMKSFQKIGFEMFLPCMGIISYLLRGQKVGEQVMLFTMLVLKEGLKDSYFAQMLERYDDLKLQNLRCFQKRLWRTQCELCEWKPILFYM